MKTRNLTNKLEQARRVQAFFRHSIDYDNRQQGVPRTAMGKYLRRMAMQDRDRATLRHFEIVHERRGLLRRGLL